MQTGLFLEFPALDGVTDQQAFQEGFRIAEEAERMGVESVWLAEYHFIPFSVLSSPVMVATAIASRTQTMRIGLGVLLLPLGNPIRIAEEIATLDHISQGRLDLGIGRGTFPEHHDAFLSPYPESRGRFEEYLEIIQKAWSTEQFSFEGEHYKCYDLAVRPKPYQKPHPPIRVGITSAETFPIIGRMGYPVFVNPSRVFALADLAEHVEAYQRAWKDAGHPGKGNVGIRLPVLLGRDRGAGLRRTEGEHPDIDAGHRRASRRQRRPDRHHRQLEGRVRTHLGHDLRRLAARQGAFRHSRVSAGSPASTHRGPATVPHCLREQPSSPSED